MIDGLADDRPRPAPTTYRRCAAAVRRHSHLLLSSGRYPLTGQGDVNTYSVFAETMRTVASPTGAAGIITPTGLATDKTTAPFFADTLSSQAPPCVLRLRERGQDLPRMLITGSGSRSRP